MWSAGGQIIFGVLIFFGVVQNILLATFDGDDLLMGVAKEFFATKSVKEYVFQTRSSVVAFCMLKSGSKDTKPRHAKTVEYQFPSRVDMPVGISEALYECGMIIHPLRLANMDLLNSIVDEIAISPLSGDDVKHNVTQNGLVDVVKSSAKTDTYQRNVSMLYNSIVGYLKKDGVIAAISGKFGIFRNLMLGDVEIVDGMLVDGIVTKKVLNIGAKGKDIGPSQMAVSLGQQYVNVAAYPSVEFDFNIVPNLACGIMMSSFSMGFAGITSIGDIPIYPARPLHRTNDTVSSCPATYCTDVDAPMDHQLCMEYPFPGTVENIYAGYACVTAEELKTHNNILAEFYVSKNINNGGMFYAKLLNMDLNSCDSKPFMSVNTDELARVNSRYRF
ncbi:hypothetical protein KVV02_001828 [Mortierella alpina]|uniref:Deoxyribonuclease NucA/NucB domain-containing protein n=1 Tax=Mortierella alpina TaxID=64518 RepID=A0A9P7ZY18_MORAP|nr:hypothetical protein KVV02_001828 [Mortierella alpina]